MAGKDGGVTVNGVDFFSNFDSGNLARVEQEETSSSDLNFTVWTRPDCEGTEYENGSRSWFYFGMRGAPPGSNVQITVLNLNSLTRLFGQGMQPVWREGQHGAWSRVGETDHGFKDGQFFISFQIRFNT